MNVNTAKFQAIIINKKNQKISPQKLTIDEKVITSSENIALQVWKLTLS